MPSGEGNENGKKKNNNRPNQQKTNFTRAARFFSTFLCRCFARLFSEISMQKLPSYTFYGGNVGRVLVHSFFTVAHFHPGERQRPAATKFHFVPPTENVSFCFFSLALAPFLVELRWPVALLSLFLCLPLSLFSKFVDMTINLSLR